MQVDHTFMLSAIVSLVTTVEAHVNSDAALGMWSPGWTTWKEDSYGCGTGRDVPRMKGLLLNLCDARPATHKQKSPPRPNTPAQTNWTSSDIMRSARPCKQRN
jgi:hypothetical protein